MEEEDGDEGGRNKTKPEDFLKWSDTIIRIMTKQTWVFSARRFNFTDLLVRHFIFFFTFDLSFSPSSRHHERKPCGVLLEVGLLVTPPVNLSICWSQRQGWLRNWLAGWERDYGSVPSAGRQKIQTVQDFLDIRKRFHDICKDLTVYCRFHVALTAYSK